MLKIIVTRAGVESAVHVEERELPTRTRGCSKKKLVTLAARADEWVRLHTSADAFVRVEATS